MSKGKKIALIVSMVAVLVVAAVLNVTLLATSNKNEVNGDVVQTSFFTSSRLERQSLRDYRIAELNEIINMEGEGEIYDEARKNAFDKKQEIIDIMEKELLIETILKAKVYNDVLVTISPEMQGANVIIDKDSVQDQDSAIIYTVVAAEAGIDWKFVTILAV